MEKRLEYEMETGLIGAYKDSIRFLNWVAVKELSNLVAIIITRVHGK